MLLLERRTAAGDRSRAIGIHAPVLAALEAGGVTERLLADAVRVSRGEARDGIGRVLGTAGKPYARLVPLKPVRKRTLGFIKGKLDPAFFDPLPEEELAAWEGR